MNSKIFLIATLIGSGFLNAVIAAPQNERPNLNLRPVPFSAAIRTEEGGGGGSCGQPGANQSYVAVRDHTCGDAGSCSFTVTPRAPGDPVIIVEPEGGCNNP